MKSIKSGASKFALLMCAVAGTMAISPASAQTSSTPAPNESRVSGGSNDHQRNRVSIGNVFEKQLDLMMLDLKKPSEKNYAIASALASCVVRRSKEQAKQYFGGPMTDDPEYQKLVGVLTNKYKNCLVPGANGVPMYVVNATLAEQMLRDESFDHAAWVERENDPVPERFYLEDGKIASIEGLNRCIASHSPVLVLKYLRSQPGSEDETVALQSLYRSAPSCGVDVPPSLEKVQHREFLATSLFQWAQFK